VYITILTNVVTGLHVNMIKITASLVCAKLI